MNPVITRPENPNIAGLNFVSGKNQKPILEGLSSKKGGYFSASLQQDLPARV